MPSRTLLDALYILLRGYPSVCSFNKALLQPKLRNEQQEIPSFFLHAVQMGYFIKMLAYPGYL